MVRQPGLAVRTVPAVGADFLPDLAAHWRFDETLGASAADSSGSSQTATLNGAVGHVPGYINDGASFDGLSSYAQAPAALVQQAVSLWMKTDSPQQTWLFQGGAGGDGNLFSLGMTQAGAVSGAPRNSAGAYFSFGNNDVYLPDVNLADGNWHQLTASWDGVTGFMLGVDGTFPQAYLGIPNGWSPLQIQPLQLAAQPSPAAAQVLIAGGGAGLPPAGAGVPFFGGIIDEVRVYSAALTQSQITALYVSDAAQHNKAQSLGVTLRDFYGNVASGDPVNGQYFSGAVSFSCIGKVSGPNACGPGGKVTLQDTLGTTSLYSSTDPLRTNTYVFHGAADQTPGVYRALSVTEQTQEELQLYATAYYEVQGATVPILAWQRYLNEGTTYFKFAITALPGRNYGGIFGFTSDGGRLGSETMSGTNSDPNIFSAGVTVAPADLAPEPDPKTGLPTSTKMNRGQYRSVLRQGDGTSSISPNPIQMLRLSLSVQPSSVSVATDLGGLRIKPTGQDFNQDYITEFSLYYGTTPNQNLFDPVNDPLLATAVRETDSAGHFTGKWSFGSTIGVSTTPLYQTWASQGYTHISTGVVQIYFIAVRITNGDMQLSTGTSLGIEIESPDDVVLSSNSLVKVAANSFFPSIDTYQSPVLPTPAVINGTGDSIAAWRTVTPSTFSDVSVSQGERGVGMLRFTLATDPSAGGSQGTLGRIHVTHTGTGQDSDVKDVLLYIHTDNSANAVNDDAPFDPSRDQVLAQAAFSTDTPRTADLVLTIDPNHTYNKILAVPKVYFIAMDFAPSASPGLNHGLRVSKQDVITLGGDGVINDFPELACSTISVNATPDHAILDAWNTINAQNVYPIPASVTQASVDQPIAKLTLMACSTKGLWPGQVCTTPHQSDGSAVWSGLKLDRWLPSAVASKSRNLVVNNKASDVKNIQIWLDSNGSGLFSATTDQIISPQSGVIHNFPVSALARTLPPDGAEIFVQDLSPFFPPDDPFPAPADDPDNPGDKKLDTPERLILMDDQADETLKEVVYCPRISISSMSFRGCLRGQEGTGNDGVVGIGKNFPYSTGTVLSGQAHIPIQGTSNQGGQSIQPQVSGALQNFFITYDIDPLASVGPSANLGLAIQATSYFLIQGPKTMSPSTSLSTSTLMVGITTNSYNSSNGYPSQSFISNVKEYPDHMLVVATNTADDLHLGSYMQQRGTFAVVGFSVQADVADALWRWVLVTATGTSASAGSVSGDVDEVSVWRNTNNDGVFNPLNDVKIGTGTFGNSGQPMKARVIMTVPERILAPTLPVAGGVIQRYFIVYHISKSAVTTDPITKLQRTLGAMLEGNAFPQNNPQLPDDPTANAFTIPNLYDPHSPLPFASKVRTLIPSPQNNLVTATPMFSSSLGTYVAPTVYCAAGNCAAGGVLAGEARSSATTPWATSARTPGTRPASLRRG
ncbi:MAG: hypothetical protein NTX64_11920 [Elusimicrobia bacterium]|nr:hypothetical protein [Elusimicrobiota bacterium]